MNADNISTMKDSYEMLFIIENGIREYIRAKMEDFYGPHWFYIGPQKVLKRKLNKTFDKFYFHELERVFLRTYENVFANLPRQFFIYLHMLYPLRNKIAHSHVLDDKEIEQLSCAYEYIFFIFKSKYRI